MKVRALVSFAGAFSMFKDEEKECSDEATLLDLKKAGYIEEVKEDTDEAEPLKKVSKSKKDVKSGESK